MGIDGLYGLGDAATNLVGNSGKADKRIDQVASRTQDEQPQAAAPEQSGDVVQISDAARLLQSASEAQKADVVRPEKVLEAQRFLTAGLYNDQGVIEATAQSMESLFRALG